MRCKGIIKKPWMTIPKGRMQCLNNVMPNEFCWQHDKRTSKKIAELEKEILDQHILIMIALEELSALNFDWYEMIEHHLNNKVIE